MALGRDGNVAAARARLSRPGGTNRRIAPWLSALRRPLYTSSLALTATSLVNAASGFVFWVAAARLFRPEAVGAGAALISAAGFLLWVSSLGLEAGIIKYLPQAPDSSALANAYLTVSSLAGGVAAGAFLATLPLWSPALAFIRQGPLAALVFLGVVVAGANCALVDYTFVALRRSQLTFARTLTQALLKLLLLIALASLPSKALGIFASWGIATVISLVVALRLFLPRALPGYRPRLSSGRRISGAMARFSLANYLCSGLFNVAPLSLIPLIVVNVLGARANAYSYVGWGAAAPLLAIPGAVATSLFAEGSHQDQPLASNVARSFKAASVLLLPAVAVMLVAGDRLLLLFGRDYSQETTGVLRVVAASALPVAVTAIYLGIARVQHRLKPLVLVPAAVAVGTLALSYALARPLGILGPAVAWLAIHGAVALAVLPGILKMPRSRQAPRFGLGDSHR